MAQKSTRVSEGENRKVDASLEDLTCSFKQDAIKQLLYSSFDENKTKISSDSLSLVAEMGKCLCTEACLRAISQALRDGHHEVDIEHLEKCLPQLMLDFP